MTLTIDDDIVLLLCNESKRTGESFKSVVNNCLRVGLAPSENQSTSALSGTA